MHIIISKNCQRSQNQILTTLITFWGGGIELLDVFLKIGQLHLHFQCCMPSLGLILLGFSMKLLSLPKMPKTLVELLLWIWNAVFRSFFQVFDKCLHLQCCMLSLGFILLGFSLELLSLAKRLKSFGSELLFFWHQFLSFFLQKKESLGKHWSG